MEFTRVGRICGFCGRVSTGDLGFAGGLGVLLCTDCLEKYHELFSSPEWVEGSRQPWWETMSDEDVLTTLPKIVAVQEQVDEFLHQWVGVARERGHTWATIGETLGVSRQAAWQRFQQSASE